MLRVRSQLSRVNAPSSLSNPPNLRSSVPSPRLGREDFPQSGEELLKTQNHPVLIGRLKRIENRASRVESNRSHFSNREEIAISPCTIYGATAAQTRPAFLAIRRLRQRGERSSRSLAAQSENRRIGAIQGGTPNKLEFLQPLSNQPDHTLQGGTKIEFSNAPSMVQSGRFLFAILARPAGFHSRFFRPITRGTKLLRG